MKQLSIGDVIALEAGWKVYHNGEKQVTTLAADLTAVVESVRVTAIGSEDDHFEECSLADVRVLNTDGTYHPEGAYLTFATYGDFRGEFIHSPHVMHKMHKTFILSE